MALIPCPECKTNVSSQAFKCPNCAFQIRKPTRGFFGVLFKYAFILFNILMAVWLVAGMGAAGEVVNSASTSAEQTGAAIGTGIAVTMILTLWVIGDIILGLLVLFTKAKS